MTNPIITLLEGLKNYISKRIVTQSELMRRYTGNICPKIQLLLEKTKRAADGWSPHWAGDLEHRGLFHVENGNDQYAVDLHKRTCACRKWDLTGIPCCHSIACMWHNHEVPEDYVASYYRYIFNSAFKFVFCKVLNLISSIHIGKQHLWQHILTSSCLQMVQSFGLL